MVQFYPFSVGVEEVFTQIVDHYGFQGVADVLSVLHELLEDDDAATGIGDDGDIWRSWRHAWRHRNNDPHNPYVPRVRGRILPPATSTRIRLLKASNLTTRSRASTRHLLSLEGVAEKETLRNSFVKAKSKEGLQGKNPSIEDASSDVSIQADQSWPLRQLMEDDVRETVNALNHGHTTVSPRRSMPVPVRKHTFPFNIISPKRRNSAASPESYGFNAYTVEAEDPIPEASSKKSLSTSSQKYMHDTSEKTPLSQRLFRTDNRCSLPSDFGSVDTDATPTKKRAVNRQARLIDGALFQGKTRKSKVLRENNNNNNINVLSPQSVQALFPSQQVSRASWLHSILVRVKGKQTAQQPKPELRKQRSSLGDCGFPSQKSRRFTENYNEKDFAPCLPQIGEGNPSFNMGLDGTCEEERNNKPLPLSPVEQSARPSLQSEIERYIFQQSPDLSAIEAPQPFIASHFVKFKQEDELRSLVTATMSGPHELSPREKALRYRYSDNSSQSPPASPKSFTTFANQNPFHSSFEVSPQDTAYSKPRNQTENEVASTVWPFRVDERSNHATYSHRTPIHSEEARGRRSPAALIVRSSSLDATDDDERGRRPATPPASPFRSKYGFKRSPQKTTRPRSRSPVKRLVGMVKSMSTNQIPTVSTMPKGDTPASTKSKKWKEFSNKFRNGFLTADLEQLEQEELMEQYASDSNRDKIRILTPPSSRERTIFPVSIKSSGQSKLWSELEYMLIETSNTFIREEVEHNRIPRESIIRAKRQWQARNRPQVIEFYYDQATQYEIIISNLRSIKLYSDYAQDAIMLNSVLHQWKILIRELSVKTLCMPDSIVRRWLHDGRRVLELLGAPTVTLLNMDKLTTLCMAVIGSAEKERANQQRVDLKGVHRRSASDGSQVTLFKHEDALLRGSQTPPPLPTPSSTLTDTTHGSRKATPQDIQEHLRRKAPGRTPVEAKQFVFTCGSNSSMKENRVSPGHGYSRSHGLTPSEERARFMYD